MIPTYNQARYLPTAIESALGQDYPNLEVVISDDCSKDDTPNVVGKFLLNKRIKYFRNEENLGRVGNYQKTLSEYATGKYALNLDGDDWLTNLSYISKAVEILESAEKIAFVFGKQGRYFEESDTLLVDSNRNKDLPGLVDGNWLFLNYPKGELSFPHLSTVYRRLDAIQVGFYTKDIVGSDSESIRRLLIDRQVGFIDEIAGIWRAHSVNESNTQDHWKHLRDLDGVESSYNYAAATGSFDKRTLERWRRQMLGLNCYEVVYLSARSGNIKTCLRFIGGLAVHKRQALLSMILSADVPLKIAFKKARQRLASIQPHHSNEY